MISTPVHTAGRHAFTPRGGMQRACSRAFARKKGVSRRMRTRKERVRGECKWERQESGKWRKEVDRNWGDGPEERTRCTWEGKMEKESVRASERAK
eukprot:5071557-Pleurochrysis_carterae.AAC.3